MRRAMPAWIALVTAILFGCGGEGDDLVTADMQDAVLRARQFSIGISQYPSTLHPNIENMVAKAYVLGLATRPLTRFNPKWELECALCMELPTIENGLAVLEDTPDGKPGIAVTFEIPQDAKWGDGTPVTSRDAYFTWEVGRHPRTGANGMELYRSIYKIDLLDDKRFTIHRDRRTFTYNVFSGFYLLPEHLDREIFEASPEEYMHRTTYDVDPTNPGLYLGPYLITDTERGSHITLERNPLWYGRKPYWDRIVIRTLERTTTLEANLLSGNIDMIAGELGMQIDQALAFDKRHGDKYRVIFKPGLEYEHIDLNLENPILADKRVRHALLYGIDREMITQQLFAGKQPVALTSVNPLDRGYTTDVPRYDYDPERAVELLEAAGWMLPAGKDVRRNDKGEPLRIELMSTAGNKTRELVEQVLQRQWKEIGIDIRIKNEAPRIFFGDTTRRREFTGMAMYAWSTAPETVPRGTLHSSQIPTEENNYRGLNYTAFSKPEMDRLIETIETELDPDKRVPLWHRIQEIYAEEVPILPLFFRANPYILPRWLDGIEPTGHFQQTTLWIEDWKPVE